MFTTLCCILYTTYTRTNMYFLTNKQKKKKGAYRSCYNNQSVDNVRLLEQDPRPKKDHTGHFNRKKKFFLLNLVFFSLVTKFCEENKLKICVLYGGYALALVMRECFINLLISFLFCRLWNLYLYMHKKEQRKNRNCFHLFQKQIKQMKRRK